MRCMGVRIDSSSEERTEARWTRAGYDAAVMHCRPVRRRSVEGRGCGGRDLPEQITIRPDLAEELVDRSAPVRGEVMKELCPELIHHAGRRLAVTEDAGEPEHDADRQSASPERVDGGYREELQQLAAEQRAELVRHRRPKVRGRNRQ